QRGKVIKACRRIKRSGVPVRPTLEARAYVRFTFRIWLQIIQNRTPFRVQTFGPVQILQEWFAQEKLSVRAIEDVEEPIAIGLQQQLASLPLPLRIDEYGGLLRIPIVDIVRCELKIPLELAGPGFERQNRVTVKVVALSVVAVVVKAGIAGRPVDEI